MSSARPRDGERPAAGWGPHADLDRELFELLRRLVARAPLFAELRARGEADDVVQDAMLAVNRRLRRGAVDDPFAYASRVAQNVARRAYVRRGAAPSVGLEAADGVGAPEADTAERVQQRFELAEVLDMVRAVDAVVADLAPSDVDIVRAEIGRADRRALARRLGVSRATLYRRRRDVLCAFVAAVGRHAAARPCPERAEALVAAAGGSGFAGARGAREHAESCPDCARTLRHLTAARHGLALLAPFPALGGLPGAPPLERVVAVADDAWAWLRDALPRAPDPGALLPAGRAAAAVVASACLGLGTAATCVTHRRDRHATTAAGHVRGAATPTTRAPVASSSRGAGAVTVPSAVATHRVAQRGAVAPPEFLGASAVRREFVPRRTRTSVAGREFTPRRTDMSAARREFAPHASASRHEAPSAIAAPTAHGGTLIREFAAPAPARARAPAAPRAAAAHGEFG